MGSAVMRLITPSGSNSTDPARPTITSGAASPMARESPRMVPVAMPGIADGRVWRQVVCQTVAPRARASPGGCRCGTARTASRVVMMMTGRISRARASGTAQHDAGVLEADQRHDRDGEQAVDDGGHGGEVLQVHLDEAVPPVGRVGELLEVQRRGDAERDSHERGEAHQPQAAEDAGPESGCLRAHDRGVVGEEARCRTWASPAMTVSMISARSTMTPKNRENQRASRKTSDPRCLVLALTGRDAAGDLAGGGGGDAHQ